MKKLFYLIAFVAFSSLTMTACTEEEVKVADDNNGGGGMTGPITIK